MSNFILRTAMRSTVLAVALLVVAANVEAQVTALEHAPLIDGTGAQLIDAKGKFIVSGIINVHGHVGENRDPQLRQYALYGVTTTTSMATDPDDIVQFKEQQKRGDLRGARILTVKSRFSTLPQPGPEIKTPEEARAKVDEIVAKGADYIKVWVDRQDGRVPKLTPEF